MVQQFHRAQGRMPQSAQARTGAFAPFEAIVEYKTTPSYPLVPLEEGWIALPSVARMRCQPVAGEPRRANCFTASHMVTFHETLFLHLFSTFVLYLGLYVAFF